MARIGVDVDGVLANFNLRFASLIRGLTGIQLPPVDNNYPNEWNYHTEAGVTPEQEKLLYSAMNHYREWAALAPYEDAKGFFAWYRANQFRHDIYFITSRHPEGDVKEQTERWLTSTLLSGFGGAPRPITVLMSSDKARLAKALKLNYFIEDKPETLINMPIGVRSILVDQPWNRDVSRFGPAGSCPFTRVANATLAAALIDEMEMM